MRWKLNKLINLKKYLSKEEKNANQKLKYQKNFVCCVEKNIKIHEENAIYVLV